MARPQLSTNQKVRNLIEKGCSTKQIVKELKVSPQVVYNTRHRLNRKQGIGGLPVTANRETGITIEQIKSMSAQLKAEREAERATVKKSLWQRIVGIFA